jgi:thiamine transport system permease protein
MNIETEQPKVTWGGTWRTSAVSPWRIATILAPLTFLGLFLFYPLISILRYGVLKDGAITLRHLGEILDSRYYRRVILFTIEQALYSSVATLALGLPAAYLLARREFRGKAVVRALLTIPFVLPTITVAIGFILLFGRNGIVNDLLDLFWERKSILYNLQAIVLAHTFFNFAIVVRLVGTAWSALDPRLDQAAASLGASPWKRFRHITLPLLRPAMLASFVLTFMYCFMSFTIVFILGDINLSTIEVEIFTLNTTYVNYELASALAIIQIMFTLLFLYIYTVISNSIPDSAYEADLAGTEKGGVGPKSIGIFRKASPPKSSGIKGPGSTLRSLVTPGKIATIGYVILIGVLILGPMIEVVRHSFIVNEGGEERYSFHWYRMILDASTSPAGVGPVDSIINSLFFAFMTVVIAVPLGTAMAYALHGKDFRGKNVLGAIFMLPLGISAITLALGLLRGYSSGWLVLNGRWYGIVIAHAILSYPFVMRSVSSTLKRFDPHLREAAMSLGADRTVSFFRIELPLIMPGILVGAIFAFSISMGELGATYMIHKPEYATLPMVIYRYIGSREFGVGIALSVVLMLIVFVSFLLIERAGSGKGSGF